MGMFDPLPEQWSEHFNEGEVFTLTDAKVVTIPTQDFGDREAVELTIEVDGERKRFSTFGSGLVAQVKRAEAREYPMRVRIERVESSKPGRQAVKLFVPEGADTPASDDIPF